MQHVITMKYHIIYRFRRRSCRVYNISDHKCISIQLFHSFNSFFFFSCSFHDGIEPWENSLLFFFSFLHLNDSTPITPKQSNRILFSPLNHLAINIFQLTKISSSIQTSLSQKIKFLLKLTSPAILKSFYTVWSKYHFCHDDSIFFVHRSQHVFSVSLRNHGFLFMVKLYQDRNLWVTGTESKYEMDRFETIEKQGTNLNFGKCLSGRMSISMKVKENSEYVEKISFLSWENKYSAP